MEQDANTAKEASKTTTNLFTKNLTATHKTIIGKRAKMFANDAEQSSVEYIQNLKKEKREVEKVLMNLEDINPTTTISLNVTSEGFDSDQWIHELNVKSVKLELIQQKLDIANAIHKRWF